VEETSKDNAEAQSSQRGAEERREEEKRREEKKRKEKKKKRLRQRLQRTRRAQRRIRRDWGEAGKGLRPEGLSYRGGGEQWARQV